MCTGDDLSLIGTVNLERESAITALTFGTEASVLCRWPLNDKACEEIGPNGAVVEGEAAVYALEMA